MNKKEYTREYLRDNFEFPERPEQPRIELISQEYDGFTYTMNKAGFEWFKRFLYDS